ncbi:MAG: GNAT family N-acetyltransferase [bacterium]|nr:GNAT family N-acetyltransferase [bacterium]
MKSDITCTMENNVVHASMNGECVGRISVPDLDFHWADGVYVRMVGIAGVGTDERFRQMGIAGQMMEAAKTFAREKGYTCSGITTNLGNNARRLYARAGYTTVFRPGGATRTLGPVDAPDAEGFSIRRYRDGDEVELMRLFGEIYRPFFGWRRKTAERWHALRKAVREEDPDFLMVAERDGEVLGWAGCFNQWVGLVSEVYVKACEDRERIAQTLLLQMEAHLVSRGIEKAQFRISDADVFSANLLARNGYAYSEMRVFMLAVLDLSGLLNELLPLFKKRLGEGAPWTGMLKLSAPGHEGLLCVEDKIVVGGGSACDAEVIFEKGVLEKVLSGVLEPWDAYLENVLTVKPGMSSEIRRLLEMLFPRVPVVHPADDMW